MTSLLSEAAGILIYFSAFIILGLIIATIRDKVKITGAQSRRTEIIILPSTDGRIHYIKMFRRER